MFGSHAKNLKKNQWCMAVVEILKKAMSIKN